MTPLFQALLKHTSDPRRIELLDAEEGDFYEPRVITQHHRLDLMIAELHYQVSMLTEVDSLVAARSHLKLYIITWCSLSDVTANLINHVHEIGIDEKDFNLTMILRNARIKKTQLPAIFLRHKRAIDYVGYSEKRNDIIHRGVLNETQLREIYGRVVSYSLRKAIGHPTASDEPHEHFLQLQDYLRTKCNELEVHMDATQALLQDIMIELSQYVESKFPKA